MAVKPADRAVIVPEYMKGWDMLKHTGARAAGDWRPVVVLPDRTTISAKVWGPTLTEAVVLVQFAQQEGVPLSWATLPLLSEVTLNQRLGMAYAAILRDAENERPGYENVVQVLKRGAAAEGMKDLRNIAWATVSAVGATNTATVVNPAHVASVLRPMLRAGAITVYASTDPDDVAFHLRNNPYLSTLEL